jgi:type I restriction enzyme S subunit
MAGEWRTARIEEVAERVAMGPFGSSIKVETFVPEGVPVISGQHLHGWRVDGSAGFNFITPEHAEKLRNANVRRGDVIFTYAGNIGQVSYVPRNSAYDCYVISQRQGGFNHEVQRG